MSDADYGCAPLSTYVPNLARIANNRDFGNLDNRVVADLSTRDPQLPEAVLKAGARHCYVVSDSKQEAASDDPRITYVCGNPWDVSIPDIDIAFFDARAVSGFNCIQGVQLLMARLRNMLRPTGAVFAILQTSYASPDWDVFNSIVLTPQGPLPTSPYLFESLLKDYTIRIMDHPAKQLPGVTSRLLRLTPKKPSLLLIFAKSESGKTSLARDFKALDHHAHVSNDYIFTDIVSLKAANRTEGLPNEILELVAGGGGQNCGNFFRALEANDTLLRKYFEVVLSLIPRNKSLVTVDLDLRIEGQFAVAKEFFKEAGFSVWVVTR